MKKNTVEKDLNYFFTVINEKIKLEAKEAGLTNHNLTTGEIKEKSLKKFLERLLPNFFKYGDGILIDSSGNKSPQQDIIIYSPFMSILTPDSKLFPIDSVFSTIEVKTKLNKTELKKSMKNIYQVKRLVKNLNGPIQCNIFAYDSDNSKTLFKNLNEIKNELELTNNDLFDNLCVHGKFIITQNPDLKSLANPNEPYDYILLNIEEKSLPYFLDSMISSMKFTSQPFPIFVKYLGDFQMRIEEWTLK